MKKQRLRLLPGAILALYILAFIPLACWGGYLPHASGLFRLRPGLAFEDAWVWQPRYGEFYSFRTAAGDDTHRANALGYFYSPLIWLQQHLVRPTIYSIRPDGSPVTSGSRKPPREQLHPEMLRALPKVEKDFQRSYDSL